MKNILKVINCIQLSINKNAKTRVNEKNLKEILKIYGELYDLIEENMIKRIDSFDEAACLLIVMSQNNLTLDRKVNCEIAVDACIEMFKRPVIYTENKAYGLEKIDYPTETTERRILIDGILQDKTLPSIETLSDFLKQMYKNAIGNRKIRVKTYYKRTSTPQSE